LTKKIPSAPLLGSAKRRRETPVIGGEAFLGEKKKGASEKKGMGLGFSKISMAISGS
jgi:hypothetical protein